MKELKLHQFESVRSLFRGFDYSLSIQSAIAGNNPGRIFVDHVLDPQTALGLTVEGYLLAGDDSNEKTNNALRRLLKEKIFSGEVFVNGDWSMSLAVHPETWEARLPELIPAHEVEKIGRYHYLCRELKLDWRDKLPDGYAVRRLDRATFDDPQIIFPDVMREWMDFEAMWWTDENFFSTGASFVLLHESQIVAWCTPDCVAGERIDVGVLTHPAHRRRGLGSVVVAATVEYCLAKGFNAVGYHCNQENVGSWKTAEKVGFERARTYAYYYYMYDPVDHLAELGWHYYRREEYSKTVGYYERVFALRDENPDYYYHLAASAWGLLGNSEKALKYLNAAVDHGWTDVDWTQGQEEFQSLHGMPDWQSLLGRMKEGVGD